MKMNYSPKDWQILSSYLDGQLSTREISILKQRLAKEPHLKQAYKEILETRHLLQNARTIPVPRSFTLTPEMAAQIKPAKRPLIPIFSFASVIATIFLVVVLLFEFVPGALSGGLVAKSTDANEMLAMEAAPMEAPAVAQDSASTPQVFQWGAPSVATGMGGGGGGDMGMVSSLPIGGGVDNPPIQEEIPVEEPVPSAENENALALKQQTEPITGAGPILGVRSAEETEAFNNSVLNIIEESTDAPVRTNLQTFPWLRFSQILLASIAIITAVVAIILRKRSA
jgi:hypothetical protein